MGYWLWAVPICVIIAMAALGYMLVCFANASDEDIWAEGFFSSSAAEEAETTDWAVVFTTTAIVGISGFLSIWFPAIEWVNWSSCVGVCISEVLLAVWFARSENWFGR